MKSLRLLAHLAALAITVASAIAVRAEHQPMSQRASDAAIARWPDGRFAPAPAPSTWNYELGTLLEGMDSVWLNTADPRYFNYIKASVDALVTPDGAIPTLKPEEHQLDNILLGRQLLFLYGVTQDKRYLTAATFLWNQLGAAAPQRRGRLLAQAALSQPDVARRSLHGRAFPRGIRADLAPARRIQGHHTAIRAHGAARARSQNRLALSRLGRVEAGALGQQANRRSRRNSGRAAWAGT